MRVTIYDTTLRDGTQGEGVAFSAQDKVTVAQLLDELGVDYIEGGWPGSNARDVEFFQLSKSLYLKHARLSAFGSTCNPKFKVEDDPNLKALLDAGTQVVTIFGKSWDLHVEKALGITLERNLELIRSSVAYLKSQGREVIYDAEHFFDGYTALPDYALRTLKAAQEAGANWIVLCDTNGGTLTTRLSEVVAAVNGKLSISFGIHAHNDSELAVANSIAAVMNGASQVQGTINGYGERCGNANLCSIIPILELKVGAQTIGPERLAKLTSVSRKVSEITNLSHANNLAFVGRSAFAHKGGVHVSAVAKDPATYEHIVPESVGNDRRVLVSDLSGKSNIRYKADEMGLSLEDQSAALQPVVARIKQLEHQGFEYESAEASLRLMIEEALGNQKDFFRVASYSVRTEKDFNGDTRSTAAVNVCIDDMVKEGIATGSGPVHALDQALRQALTGTPGLETLRLYDYKVRVLDGNSAAAAKVRVLAQSGDGEKTWTTVGVSDNIIEASCQALTDAINYKLLLRQSRPEQPDDMAKHAASEWNE